MSRVIVINHLTLDGVMQAPGRPDEDLRGGFEHGGWSPPYGDAVMGSSQSTRLFWDPAAGSSPTAVHLPLSGSSTPKRRLPAS